MKSVYIHIPYCKSICTYCDFCKFYYKEEEVSKYLDSLLIEINNQYSKEVIDTLYIGGGTPSSLSLKLLDKLSNIVKIFNLNKEYEFTFECNIEDINDSLLDKLILMKVNRLSIGVQSFNKKNLTLMNRHTTFKDTLNKINLCKSKGINNINIDLIYALPNESILTLYKDLRYIIKLNITHISTYSLIIEDNTILKNKGIKSIKEDKDAYMYKVIYKYLKKHNFIHYEVSNFAKEGYQSRHNLTYWHNEEYYGFGCGASGYIGNIRYENTRNIKKYLNKEYTSNKNVLSKKDCLDNEVMLNLRLLKGINKDSFYKKYNVNIKDIYDLDNLIKEGYLVEDSKYIYIPEKYIYIMNEILVRII